MTLLNSFIRDGIKAKLLTSGFCLIDRRNMLNFCFSTSLKFSRLRFPQLGLKTLIVISDRLFHFWSKVCEVFVEGESMVK